MKRKGSRAWKALSIQEKGRLLVALDKLSFEWAEAVKKQGEERAKLWLWQARGGARLGVGRLDT